MPKNQAELRRASRLAAVQALYQMEISGEPSKAVIQQFLDHRFGEADEPGTLKTDEAFFEDLVLGVVREQEKIDQAIAAHLSEKWSLKRLDMTLRALMRSAGYEVMARPDVPALVVIDEYVSLATEFFDDKEAAFVNGALEKLAKKVRAAEFGLTGSAIEHG